MKTPIALFGEAEKGAFRVPLFIHSLPLLHDALGNPPEDSHGIPLAVKTLLFGFPVFYWRVHQEGYSLEDYLEGLSLIKGEGFEAIALPGVGSSQILDAFLALCRTQGALLLIEEADLFDYFLEAK